jgi:hypothetical protein
MSIITKLQANLSIGKYASDTTFVRKQIEKGGSFFSEFAPVVCDENQLDAMNQKGVKRFTQAVNFALSGNVKDFDEVTAFMVSAVMLSKEETISFSRVHFLCGVGVDGATHIKGVSRQRLARFIGNAGTVGTITSKVSRTTGKGGFFTALGITAKADRNSFTLTANAKQNPLLLAYAVQLEKMTDGALALIREEKSK